MQKYSRNPERNEALIGEHVLHRFWDSMHSFISVSECFGFHCDVDYKMHVSDQNKDTRWVASCQLCVLMTTVISEYGKLSQNQKKEQSKVFSQR